MGGCSKCQLREMMKHDGPGWADCPNCGNENMNSDIIWAGVENGVGLLKVHQPEKPPNSYKADRERSCSRKPVVVDN